MGDKPVKKKKKKAKKEDFGPIYVEGKKKWEKKEEGE